MTAQSNYRSAATNMSADEWAVRVDLAAAYRLVALYGWDDLVFTHLSARIPGPEHHFLINPQTHLFDEITASSLVKIDINGDKVGDSPSPINYAGFVIHSAIHAGREDAMAVMHLHTLNGQAVAAMSEGLLPISQTAMVAAYDLAYHDFEGLANNLDERERLVADLGTKHSLILRSHGTLTVGSTIGQAFLRMYFLEKACDVQVRMLTAGRAALIEPDPETAAGVGAQVCDKMIGPIGDGLAWPALLRKLDRIDPSYRD